MLFPLYECGPDQECFHPERLSAGKSVVLQRAVAAAIKAQLAVPWLPPNCRLPLHAETQVGISQSTYTAWHIYYAKQLPHSKMYD